MATRTVVCPECGAGVPYGRLSCIACGALLASVAGSARRPTVSEAGSDAETGPTGDDAGPAATSGSGVDDAEPETGAVDDAGARPMPSVLRDWTGPLPAGSDDRDLRTPAGPVGTVPRPRWARDLRSDGVGSSSHPDADEPVRDPLGGGAMLSEPDDAARSGASSPSGASWPGQAETVTSATNAGPPPAPGVPGAYVAPAIAAASITDGSITSVPATPRPDRWFSTPTPAGDPSSTPGKAGLFSDLPFRSPGDVAGWAVAVGAFIGMISFVLPVAWSDNGVMGTQPHDTLTGLWGLANPANLIPMVAALAVLLLAIVPNRIPTSIRGIVLPILIGGSFLGIWWSYATGSYGLGWGVDALGVGGLVLVVGGAVAAWRSAAPASDPAPTDRTLA